MISIGWRRRIGIEPIYDSVSAARAGLKSGAPTSDASISVNYFSDLQFIVFSKSILSAFLSAFRINLSVQTLRDGFIMPKFIQIVDTSPKTVFHINTALDLTPK